MADEQGPPLESDDFLTVSEAADLIGVEPSRIGALLADHALVAFQMNGEQLIPMECFVALPADKQYVVELRGEEPESTRLVRVRHEPLNELRGTALVLHDGGYSDSELAWWLWAPNRFLGGRPIDALRRGEHKAVNRIASTQSW